ncbi:MAG: orotate phosphoribosyltransferase [Alphaproteobacteria bacterium]|nr:orotate phosphoribosyltransferase [Alphaproteobacteria bacterium]
MAADPARITARILIETESVLFRPEDPFELTSGRTSPVYIDCRRLISFPRARAKLMDMGAELIEEAIGFESIDIVAGGETAGIPFAAWIADRLMLPMAYVRKKPKGFGRGSRIEGQMISGDRVLLVEDLTTDGGSKISFVEGIRDAGGECAHTFVIFHYGIFPKGIAELESNGIKLHALATWWDVVECAEEEGYFNADALAAVREFLNDPHSWQEAHPAKAK